MEPLPELITDEELNRLLADRYLEDWYRVTRTYKEKLGYPTIAPYCKQFKSSRQYESTSDLAWQSLSSAMFDKINLSVMALTLPDQAAIQREMKNRFSRAKVWRYSLASSYPLALEHVTELMMKRGLFD